MPETRTARRSKASIEIHRLPPAKLEEAVKRYKSFLSEKGLLFTRERLRILQGVLVRNDHFSADDLLFHMRQEGLQVSRATLYRNLKLLAQAGFVTEADLGHGHVHYELVRRDSPPHEHLVCMVCGSIEEVNYPLIHQSLQELCSNHQFKLDHYQLRVQGICKNCQDKP